MAYTNPWSDTDPPGSQNANTIDDELRQLRLDIHERMDDIVDDWTDDPVVLSVGGGGGHVVKHSEYNDALAGGSKEESNTTVAGMLSIRYRGTTDANGVIVINFNELTGGWVLADLLGHAAFPNAIFKYWMHIQDFSLASRNYVGRISFYSDVSNTLTLTILKKTDDPTKVDTRPIDLMLYLLTNTVK